MLGQGRQISVLVVRRTVLPAAKHDANPFESQGSHRGMVILTTLALLLVIGTRPNRLRNRVSRPFVKTLAQKLGTRPAKMQTAPRRRLSTGSGPHFRAN
jgi:hypothetical protein